MVPKADMQLECVVWIQEYFKLYGNHSPNDVGCSVGVMKKNTVYQKYVAHMTKTSEIHRPYVSEPKFCNLWSHLFPNCCSRPWCAETGKCRTCQFIDENIRRTDDPAVLMKLKEAHQLHRGGLFMLERVEYVW